ncbi:MAG: YidC/Oxa1 family membrane protein insertase [Clostridia bacterium]|nr:YidC/Oxa1 family membrane protein insertase [Clostridia bacterium]
MELMNLLSGVEIAVFGQTFDISLNWIGKLIRLIVGGVDSVGVGIILFSIALKVVVLPFDIYQRISMRKQNLKMKENKDKMEKLQKQYANDKAMYNQKVMEMYRESGISMFSSCLPMILSLVIFIVAINAFNAYAQYANVQNYNTMVKAYNEEITSYAADVDEYSEFNLDSMTYTVENEDGEAEQKTDYFVVVSEADKYINVYVPCEKDTTDLKTAALSYKGDYRYFVDKEKMDAAVAAGTIDLSEFESENADEADDKYVEFFYDKAQSAVVKAYNDEVYPRTSFIWIRNVWATDASYKHPVLSYSDFSAEVSREEFTVGGDDEVSFGSVNGKTNAYKAETYNQVTGKLSAQKNQANGFYVLIVLSIGTILLQQWISMRSQKEQQKYSSVDGSSGSQQKIMLVVMTVMFAIFSFMYSAAFSIYMIMSNVLSLFSTLVINKLVDISQSKKEAEAFKAKYDHKYAAQKRKEQSVKGKNKKK